MAWSVAISVAGHVVIAACLASPLLWASAGSAGAWSGPPEPPNPDEDDRTRLGIERSRTVTLTWLGYEDPEPHFAPWSETEQAALTPTPGEPGDPGSPGPLAPSAASPDASPPTPPAPATNPSEEATPTPTPATGETEPSTVPVEPDVHFLDAELLLPTVKPGGEVRPAPPRPAREASERDPSPDTPPSPPMPPTPTGGGGGGSGGERGDPSDRASEAVSNEPTLVVDPGRPAAAEGLELLTDHIRWRRVDQHLARPRNPTIAITFDANGRPSLVEFVPDARGIRQSTGHRGIDETLINGVYRWRARGERIDQLQAEGGEGVRIVLRVLLVPER
ncbi:MAG: hypothetical protein EA378_08670 [Phycisphaerales bacterium]|nr:MAG: hypothetical protein EA378_08670 [Phycisphaerales bacterium]